MLLRASLARGDSMDRQHVETFFSSLPRDSHTSIETEVLSGDQPRRAVRLVESAVGSHHFGNTPVGFKSALRPDADASGCVVHIVNTETIRQLSAAVGLEDVGGSDRSNEKGLFGEQPLAPSRFRPNIVLAGLAAWSEFDWVGKHVRIGSVTFKVLSRTVRCRAANVDARTASGRADLDIPELLKLHFPNRGPYLGVYATVVEGGLLSVGDSVCGVVADPLVVRRSMWQQRLCFIFFLIAALLSAVLAAR